MLVVDTSVAVKWFVQEPDSDRARVVLNHNDLIAPELLVAEVANVLWTKARHGRFSDTDANAALERLAPIFVFQPLATLASAALRIAHVLDRAVYDCFFLALAEREACPLITADLAFVEKARRARRSAHIRSLARFAE